MVLALALLLGACGPAVRAPVGERGDLPAAQAGKAPPRSYRVRPGDSLYSIAWRYDLDWQRLARWNGIDPPYTIYADQHLRLTPPPTPPRPAPSPSQPMAVSSAPSTPAPTEKSPSRAKEKQAAPARPAPTGPLRWQWPAKGPILRTYDDRRPGKKGIDIGGRAGDPVYAAGPGRVVYSGSGLVGYGRLIIVKHNDRFLSAYAHNRKLLVNEGDAVQGGQRIAEMGSSGTDRSQLHFEIRRDGRPTDPLRYLPKR